jgi:hypothetical protein
VTPDLAADLAKLVLGWAPTHEPTHDLLRRALAQADPHGGAWRVGVASPDGLVVECLRGSGARSWLLLVREGQMEVRPCDRAGEVCVFSALFEEG